MAGEYRRMLKNIGLAMQGPDSPEGREAQRQEDLNPDNLKMIDRELARSPHPVQQAALMNEKQRLQALQLQQMQQATQQFAPRLAQELDVQTHTGMPAAGPADNMIKLMLMMRKRMAPRMMPQQPVPTGDIAMGMPQ